MNPPDIYDEIDFDNYIRIAKNITRAEHIDVAMVGSDGQIVWKNFDCNKQMENLARSISLFKEKSRQGCRLVSRHETEAVAYCSLGMLAGKVLGAVIFRLFVSKADSLAQHSISDCLDEIAALLRKEIRYLHEVNALAIELGDRYDELAMLRSTETSVAEPRESRHILSSYVRKYAEHLDIDYACIWIPSRQYFFPAGRMYSPKDSACERTLHDVAACCYSIMCDTSDVIAINRIDAPLLNNTALDINQKILAIPVLNSHEEACGVLISLNAHNKRDFTYSYRATADAVCKRIYKYLDATEDPLTHLYNKTGFEQSVWRDIHQSSGQKHLALINLCQFSVINGAYGTCIGDQLLKKIGQLLNEKIHGRGFAARIEADHFALLVTHGDSCSVEHMMQDIIHDISTQHYMFDGRSLSVTARCSIIEIGEKTPSLSDCLYTAQLALETTTANNDATDVIVFHPGNTELVKRKQQMGMVETIKQALADDRFTLHAQNIRALGGHHDHYEILVRMLDENGDIVPPNDFIPTAERYRLMPMVDKWVLHHTLKMLDEYDVHHTHPNIKWGINLSGDSMSDKGFLDHVSKTLRNTSMCASNLYFEITETAVIENYQNFVSFMQQVYSMGCQFALDDFGSGLCSFSYLKKLAVDYLKIDGSLVKDIVNSELDHTIVSSVASIASVMGVKTIAEYVENDDIIAVLNTLGIDYAQGFGIMKPMPLREIIENMQDSHVLRQHSIL